MKSRLIISSCLASLMLVLGPVAKANSLNLDSRTPSGANTAFNYTYDLTTGTLETGDYFTLFDVPGLVSATTNGSWVPTEAFLGETSPFAIIPDSASILNVTYTYGGPTITSTGSNLISGFQILSSDSGVQLGDFITVYSGGGSFGYPETITKALIPAPAVTPEPSSLILLGTGLVGLAGSIRRRFTC